MFDDLHVKLLKTAFYYYYFFIISSALICCCYVLLRQLPSWRPHDGGASTAARPHSHDRPCRLLPVASLVGSIHLVFSSSFPAAFCHHCLFQTPLPSPMSQTFSNLQRTMHWRASRKQPRHGPEKEKRHVWRLAGSARTLTCRLYFQHHPKFIVTRAIAR